jgi:hypothetical protein
MHKPKQSSALTVEKDSAVGRLGESLTTGIIVHIFTENTLSFFSFFLIPILFPIRFDPDSIRFVDTDKKG